MATTRALGVSPWAVGHRLGGEDERGGAVVDAGGVAGGDGEVGAVDALELRQRLGGGARARVLVDGDDDRVALPLRDRHRHDLVGEAAGVLRGGPARLAAGGEGVLVGAGDAVVGGDVVGGLGHRMGAERRLHLRVREAPADGGVVDGVGAGEGAVGLRHHEGGAGHALDAAGDHHVAVAGADRPGGHADRVHAGAA